MSETFAMWKRLFNMIRAFCKAGTEIRWESPEVIVQQAREEMRKVHEKNNRRQK